MEFFSPLKKSVTWIGSCWKILYRTIAENDQRGDVVHILTHRRSNHWLPSGEFILTAYFQDSHQYNVWELSSSPTKSVPRLPLASTCVVLKTAHSMPTKWTTTYPGEKPGRKYSSINIYILKIASVEIHHTNDWFSTILEGFLFSK